MRFTSVSSPSCCSLLVLFASSLASSCSYYCQAFQPAAPVAPASRISTRPTTTELQAQKPASSWWGPAATAVAGWTLASQIATAAVMGGVVPTTTDTAPQQQVMQDVPTVLTSAFGSVETLDFSMPSYDDSAKSAPKPKADAPVFNPFGDFEPKIVDQDENRAEKEAAAAAAKEEKEAAAAASKAEKEAAAAASKAEKEAAAAAAKAEKEAAAAAKKAEKEAKRQEELEKQRAFKEAQASKAEAGTEAAPPAAVSSFEMPDMPDIKVPDIKVPEVKLPDFKAPDIQFSMPKVDMPKMDMPKMEMPSGVDVPKVDMPKVDMPKIDMPKFDVPKVSLPSFGGGSGSTDDVFLESQEVRDEKARTARQVYLQADAEAKEAEEAARAVRNAANDKKKLANAAKDAACETRPGGKLICLRNPFSAGF